MNSKANQSHESSDEKPCNEGTRPAEQRQGIERRTRKDVSYQYEITLDPKPERREPKDRRKS